MEVITIGGYIYPNNYQNPNKYALFGRFFVPYSCRYSHLFRGIKHPKNVPTQQSLKTPSKKVGGAVGVAVGVAIAYILAHELKGQITLFWAF